MLSHLIVWTVILCSHCEEPQCCAIVCALRISSSNFEPLCPVGDPCKLVYFIVLHLFQKYKWTLCPVGDPPPHCQPCVSLPMCTHSDSLRFTIKLVRVSVDCTIARVLCWCVGKQSVVPSIMSASRGPLADWTPSLSHHQLIPFIRTITDTTNCYKYYTPKSST